MQRSCLGRQTYFLLSNSNGGYNDSKNVIKILNSNSEENDNFISTPLSCNVPKTACSFEGSIVSLFVFLSQFRALQVGNFLSKTFHEICYVGVFWPKQTQNANN